MDLTTEGRIAIQRQLYVVSRLLKEMRRCMQSETDLQNEDSVQVKDLVNSKLKKQWRHNALMQLYT